MRNLIDVSLLSVPHWEFYTLQVNRLMRFHSPFSMMSAFIEWAALSNICYMHT